MTDMDRIAVVIISVLSWLVGSLWSNRHCKLKEADQHIQLLKVMLNTRIDMYQSLCDEYSELYKKKIPQYLWDWQWEEPIDPLPISKLSYLPITLRGVECVKSIKDDDR